MRLGLITAFHGRPALSALWAEHTSQFGLPVFASVTEGDAANVLTAQRFGFTYREMPNEPVGDKFQIALDMAMEAGCDAVMILGSDDFISAAWIEAASGALDNGEGYITPASAAVHSPSKGTYLIKFNGRSASAGGAGRCVHREAVLKADGLWRLSRSRALDSESHGRLLAAGFTCKVVNTAQVPVVDIKTGTNIWRWETWRGGGHKCTAEQALWMISVDIRIQLASLPSC